MSDSLPAKALLSRSVRLGIVVGWLSHLGLKTFLPIIVLVGARLLSFETENEALWLEHTHNSAHPVWYAMQVSVFIGSILAGMLASVLAPRKAIMVPIALIILSLLATAFEQFPRPLSAPIVLVWAGGPCIGLLLGWILGRKFARSDA